MKTTNHTLGPWEVKSKKILLGNKGPLCIISRQEKVKIVCEIGAHSSLENHANANLIAASPDMFDALQAICDAFGDQDSLLIDQAKAALAKAKGEA
jgi:hypothetical protein